MNTCIRVLGCAVSRGVLVFLSLLIAACGKSGGSGSAVSDAPVTAPHQSLKSVSLDVITSSKTAFSCVTINHSLYCWGSPVNAIGLPAYPTVVARNVTKFELYDNSIVLVAQVAEMPYAYWMASFTPPIPMNANGLATYWVGGPNALAVPTGYLTMQVVSFKQNPYVDPALELIHQPYMAGDGDWIAAGPQLLFADTNLQITLASVECTMSVDLYTCPDFTLTAN